MSIQSATKKNLEIEVLRGIAVFMTVLCHLPVLLPFHSDFIGHIFFDLWTPWTGVDLFLCISGFVVSKAYIDFFDQHREQGRFWLAAQSFFIRRVYRLLPSAWLWVAVGFVCSIVFNHTGVFSSWFQNLRSAAVVMTFTGNFANQFGGLLHPNDIYWSLALEEQFYFLFPLFLLFVIPTAWRVRWLLVLIGIQFCINRNPFGTPAQAMASSFRFDPIMWGVLVFFFTRSSEYALFEPVFLRRSKWASFAATGILLYLLVAIPSEMIGMPIAVGLVAIVTALLVFLASFEGGYLARLPVVTPLLVWLGARSYGVYLIHIVAYRLTFEGWTRYVTHQGRALAAQDTLPLVITAAILIIFLAEINYRFVEVPLRNKGAQLARQRMLASGA